MSADYTVKESISILTKYSQGESHYDKSEVKSAAKFLATQLKAHKLQRKQLIGSSSKGYDFKSRDIKKLASGNAHHKKTFSISDYAKLRLLAQDCDVLSKKVKHSIASLSVSTHLSQELGASEFISSLSKMDSPRKIKRQLKQHLLRFSFIGNNGLTSSINNQKKLLLHHISLQLLATKKPSLIKTLKTLAEVLKNPQFPSALEIRTGRVTRTSGSAIEVAVEKKSRTKEKRIAPNLTPKVLENQLQVMQSERLWRLQNLEEVYNASLLDPMVQTQTKFFPSTHAWYVGSCQKTEEAPFEKEMAAIGKTHEISVVTDSREKIDHALIFADDLDAAYPQDYVEFSKREIRIPYTTTSEHREKIKLGMDEAIYSNRSMRFEPYNQTMVRISPIWTSIVGQVFDTGQQEKALRLASALGVSASMNLTYSEGGNTLSGEDNKGNPYIIIGKDSYAASKALLENDLGRKLSEREVKVAFGIDYGIPIDQIFFVEQPGDFHLDMNMAIIGDKVIAINDAEAAFNFFEPEYEKYLVEKFGIKDSKQIDTFKKQSLQAAALKKQFEDQTAKDLERQGFTVKRIPGIFQYKGGLGPHIPAMNFFNMVSAITPKKERIIIAMGCINNLYEKLFLDMVQDTGFDKVYFLDSKSTQDSLAKHGGISCRTKTM